jgi:UDP-hydrolysing UDP-N-acetyl-D-glucosamine 2-epimerase
MKKICVVITARTSYAKIKPILQAIQSRKNLSLQIVCAASAVLERYGNTHLMVQNDGFAIDEYVYMLVEGETLLTSAKSTGLGIIEFSSAFARLQPNAVMVMADRYEILSPAIAATYQNIPLIHVQGGEISGNIDEKVRHAVTKLADLHFPATQKAADIIIRMGEDPDRVILSGCPSLDIAKSVIDRPEMDFDIYKKYGGVGSFPDLSNGYYVVMQHPVTTEYEDGLKQIRETLYAMNRVNLPVLWFWPNVDAGGDYVSKGIRAFRENEKPLHMHFLKNMEPRDFMTLLYHSKAIVGNSSVAIRECSFLGVPAVNVGSRQHGRERGPNVTDTEYSCDQIYKALTEIDGANYSRSQIYGDGNAGIRIADTIEQRDFTFSKTMRI